MSFSIFFPPDWESGSRHALYWLSGLTCTDENFVLKAGAQRYAAEQGLILVAPDTSPRGPGVADAADRWDLGTGAGFYVDATREPWSVHYRMYSYVTDELPVLLEQAFGIPAGCRAVAGHSMGGHGALVCAARNPDIYASASAFAPICAPSRCPWGRAAFAAYLGDDVDAWLRYDAAELLAASRYAPGLLVDQGEEDEFLADQLLPAFLEQACAVYGTKLTLRRHAGYDHSYYFIASFIGDHVRHHAAALRAHSLAV